MKRGIVITVVLLALLGLGAGGYWYKNRADSTAGSFRTAVVSRGDLLQTITASGTLQAEEVIDVGSQVTGRIASFGTDKAGKQVDYKSEVEAGKVLATIDPAVYKSEVDAAQAAVDQAKASVVSTEADLNQLKAKLDQAAKATASLKVSAPKVDLNAKKSASASAKAGGGKAEAKASAGFSFGTH
jgi:HlyD family secretion protein